ncbi:putative transcription factor interactor and regulator CCHC(Zn) family [Helianthus debilis subsp. tardiflorus]
MACSISERFRDSLRASNCFRISKDLSRIYPTVERTSTDEEEKTSFWREKNSEFLKKKQAEQKKDSRTCFKCNNVGHIAKECTQAIQSKQGVFRKISEKVFVFESPLDRTKLFKDSMFEIGI